MNKNIVEYIFLLIVISGCGHAPKWSFESSIKVKGYPIEMSVEDAVMVPINAVGIRGIKCIGDNLLVTAADTSGCMSVVSKEGALISRPFLKTGSGPGEVLYPPYISWIKFVIDENGHNLALFYDNKGKVLKVDINESVSKGIAQVDCLIDSLDAMAGSRYYPLNPSTIFYLTENKSRDGYQRSIVPDNSVDCDNSPMEVLDGFTSKYKNNLSTLIMADPSGSMVVEAGSRIDAIHLYSLDGSFNRTIYSGNIRITDSESSVKCYYDVKAFKDYFAALYLGISIDDLDEGNYNSVEIRIFDWKGNPLARVLVPAKGRYFDIDTHAGCLYVADEDFDGILCYDIAEILKIIQLEQHP